MGKFDQIPMSPIKLFQGLLLYSLPWLFALPMAFELIYKRVIAGDRLVIYLTTLFAAFFFIWLIPAQKSHHYAIPALPYLLMLMLIAIQEKGELKIVSKWIPLIQSVVAILLLLFLSLALYLAQTPYQTVAILLVVMTQLVALFFFWRPNENLIRAITIQGVGFVALWSIILSFYFLPLVPSTVATNLTQADTTIYLADRRSYFFEQAIGKTVLATDATDAKKRLDQGENISLIVYQSRLKSLNPLDYKVESQWKKWIRKVKLKEIKMALAHRSLAPLQETVYLLRPK